jgi:hypothetical protein
MQETKSQENQLPEPRRDQRYKQSRHGPRFQMCWEDHELARNDHYRRPDDQRTND